MKTNIIFVVTVTSGDGTTRIERFSNRDNLEKWLKYMEETSSAKCEITERGWSLWFFNDLRKKVVSYR